MCPLNFQQQSFQQTLEPHKVYDSTSGSLYSDDLKTREISIEAFYHA